MSLDIFNPKISVVPRGMAGKTILIYGQNSSGKTMQATRLSKPFYLGFEKGLNAIAGIPYHYVTKWSEFRTFNRQISGKKAKEARELYDTIIIDTVKNASMYCQSYVAGQHGATDIGSGNDGWGLWAEYEREFWGEIDTLTSAGFTVVFIGHSSTNKKTEQEEPEGDIRSMGVVRDLSDIVIFTDTNGVDEDGNVVLSTGYVRETPEYFARSRFDLMPNVIDPFTAENLEEAINIGIDRQEQAKGGTVTFEEFAEQNAKEKLVFSEVKEQLIELGKKYHEAGKVEVFIGALEDTFGEGIKVADLIEKQVEAMSVLTGDLTEQLEVEEAE